MFETIRIGDIEQTDIDSLKSVNIYLPRLLHLMSTRKE
jgi:hypothetical protein